MSKKHKPKSSLSKGFGSLIRDRRAREELDLKQRAVDRLMDKSIEIARTYPDRSVYFPVPDAAGAVAIALVLAEKEPLDKKNYQQSASFWLSLMMLANPEMEECIAEIEKAFELPVSSVDRAKEMIRVASEIQNAMQQEQERQIESIETEIETDSEP